MILNFLTMSTLWETMHLHLQWRVTLEWWNHWSWYRYWFRRKGWRSAGNHWKIWLRSSVEESCLALVFGIRLKGSQCAGRPFCRNRFMKIMKFLWFDIQQGVDWLKTNFALPDVYITVGEHLLPWKQGWPTFCMPYAKFFKHEYQCLKPLAISCNDVISHH